MPTFSKSFLRGLQPGLIQGIASFAGSEQGGREAYDRELLNRSRISKALAEVEDQRRISELTSPTAARNRALLESGIPLDSGEQVDELLQTGKVGAWQPGMSGDLKGAPTAPAWFDSKKMGPLASRIAAAQAVQAGEAKGAKDYYEGQHQLYETGLTRDLVNGVVPADQLSRGLSVLKATPAFKIPEGYTGNQFTGDIDIQAPVNATRQGYIGAQTQERKAAAAENYAQAAQAKAAASKYAAATAPAGGGAPVAMPAKSMPAAALKMRQEAFDAIGTASNMSADLGALVSQIEGGGLNLGPVSNLISEGRNFAGHSSENSRNYQSFKATLERLRNDSLRLNKGVQTDGDAQRAWNELLTNINDPQVVAQRLREIDAINRRAVELQQFNLNQIDQNYGRQPMDTAPLRTQPAAVGARPAQAPAPAQAQPQATPGKTVVRTGRDATGRRVLQFNDGSISYAD
jgi:hypothetical protein